MSMKESDSLDSICWMCLGTGLIVDGKYTYNEEGKRIVIAGPENGKPCECILGKEHESK